MGGGRHSQHDLMGRLRRRNSKKRVIARDGAVRAAIYLRRSTNAELQAESLEIQEEVLRKYASDKGFLIMKEYRESASGRDAEGREQFLRLIDDVTSGAADYEAILVRDVSRWGRFDNIDESAYYEFLCFRHGVEVVYVEESFARDAGPYAALQKSMKRVMAADFSREKSRIVTHGKRRAAAQGFRAGAPPPFGMKRILVTPDGGFVQDLPPKAHKLMSCYKTKLAPANNRGTTVVQTIFKMFVEDRARVSKIAAWLNETGEPRPASGAKWYPATVLMVLTNEAYAGVASLWTHGEKGEDERLIRVEGAYDAVISLEQFRLASERLELMYQAPTNHARLLHESRKSLELWGHLPASLVSKLAGNDRSTHHQTHLRHELLEDAFAVEIACEKSAIRNVLARHFSIVDRGSSLVLDDCFTLGFTIGWSRTDLLHRPIEFAFNGACAARLLICIGVTTTPAFAREILCSADPELLGSAPLRLLRSRDARKSSRLLRRIASEESLIRRVRQAFYTHADVAADAFLRIAQEQPKLVFKSMQPSGRPTTHCARRERRCPKREARFGWRSIVPTAEKRGRCSRTTHASGRRECVGNAPPRRTRFSRSAEFAARSGECGRPQQRNCARD